MTPALSLFFIITEPDETLLKSTHQACQILNSTIKFVLRKVPLSMISMAKSHLRPAMNVVNHNAKIAAVPHFRTEQSSNDYIASLCNQNLFQEAIKAFNFLISSSTFHIGLRTYGLLISACSSLRSLEEGRKVHVHMLSSNLQPDMIVQNHILNMYGKCGSLNEARKVFDEMSERNLVSWTSIIAGYAQKRQEDKAVGLYLQMLRSGLLPDQFTFGSILKACSGVGDVWLGRQLHGQVVKSEYGSHLIAQNALVAMYAKVDLVFDAWDVFNCIETKDLISWGSIIAALSQLDHETEALEHFKDMLRQVTFLPNEFIFGSAFSACRSLLQPEYGKQIHTMCIKFGFGKNIFAGCSLCDMYAKCGFLDSARTAFYQIKRPDLVSWNAIISGFAYAGDANEAVSFLCQMRHLGLIPDEITLRSLLCAFTSPSSFCHGLQVHGYIIKTGFDQEVSVCNTLLSMYSKSSRLSDAFHMFQEMKETADIVSWNAILTACLGNKESVEVFQLLKQMLMLQVKPDHITLLCVLAACTEAGSLETGNQIHCYSIKSGMQLNVSVTNGLIDMYTKCGFLTHGRKLFDSMEEPDVVSWSSLIMGYAQCGYGREALDLFRRMKTLDVSPNEITFVGVLTACSHVGLVEEGMKLYNTMEIEHGIVPTKEHCSCVVDMLARAGCLNEAERYIHQMAFDPDVVVYKTLLAACKNQGNLKIGRRAAENILRLDPSNSAAHVLLSNIYASNGKWGDVARIRSMMKQMSVRKSPGQSWIEDKNRVHIFTVEDVMHPEREKIYAILEELWLQMLDAGYKPLIK